MVICAAVYLVAWAEGRVGWRDGHRAGHVVAWDPGGAGIGRREIFWPEEFACAGRDAVDVDEVLGTVWLRNGDGKSC